MGWKCGFIVSSQQYKIERWEEYTSSQYMNCSDPLEKYEERLSCIFRVCTNDEMDHTRGSELLARKQGLPAVRKQSKVQFVSTIAGVVCAVQGNHQIQPISAVLRWPQHQFYI